MNHCFFQLYDCSGRCDTKVELVLSNSAMKAGLKAATIIDIPTLELKKDLASFKTKEDNIDVEKLYTVHPDLSKLSNILDNDVVRKLRLINWLLKSMLLIL